MTGPLVTMLREENRSLLHAAADRIEELERASSVTADLIDALYPFLMHDDDDIEHELEDGLPNTVRVRVTDDEYRAAHAALSKALGRDTGLSTPTNAPPEHI